MLSLLLELNDKELKKIKHITSIYSYNLIIYYYINCAKEIINKYTGQCETNIY